MEEMKNSEQKKKDFIWNNFCRLFPDMAAQVTEYSRTGSKSICLKMDNGLTLYFMYYHPGNWNLGTKPWRMKPKELADYEKSQACIYDKGIVSKEKVKNGLSLKICRDCVFCVSDGCTLPLSEECHGPVKREKEEE